MDEQIMNRNSHAESSIDHEFLCLTQVSLETCEIILKEGPSLRTHDTVHMVDKNFVKDLERDQFIHRENIVVKHVLNLEYMQPGYNSGI